MKKITLKICGLLIMVTLMFYNVQIFRSDSSITLASLTKIAFAQGEGGSGGSCFTQTGSLCITPHSDYQDKYWMDKM